MDLQQYWKLYGIKRIDWLARKVGSSRSYLQQLAYGYRYPSATMAAKLVEASDGELTLFELMFKMRMEKPQAFRPPRLDKKKARREEPGQGA